MGLFKDFFTGANLPSRDEVNYYHEEERSRRKWVICRYCGRKTWSDYYDYQRLIRDLQGSDEGCGRGNHAPILIDGGEPIRGSKSVIKNVV